MSAKLCPLTPFRSYDGWAILYTINPSICQLRMKILGYRMRWRGPVFRSWHVTKCHLASLLIAITEPV